MKRKESLIPAFIIFFIIALLFFVFSESRVVTGVAQITHTIFNPITDIFLNFGNRESNQIAQLKKEKTALLQKLVEYKEVQKENNALRDQFETTNPRSLDLIPAKIIGAPAFIPGVNKPEVIILNRGSDDGVRVNQGVIVANNLIGIVKTVTPYASKVFLTTHPSVSFKVKTVAEKDQEKNALGLLKGQGSNTMVMDSILLSESVNPKDTVVTFGDMTEDGYGIPPDIIVGSVTAVDKKPSAVFQKADVSSIIDVSTHSTVFIIKRIQ